MSHTDTLTRQYIDESYAVQELFNCVNNAPYICYRSGARWWLAQGCCNSWECPRCGQVRARHEYGRMVEGVKSLTGHTLYFYTLTCRGADCTLDEAEAGYMKWCNRLLTAMRTKCKRSDGHWSYALVTERQERGHPHSHMLCTWIPEDTSAYIKGEHIIGNLYAKRDRLWSSWLHTRVIDAQLGEQWDCTLVESNIGVAKYIAKYLFKSLLEEPWPAGWRRVRYSHSWPKLPDLGADSEAFPVISPSDWQRVRRIKGIVRTHDPDIVVRALARGVENVGVDIN